MSDLILPRLPKSLQMLYIEYGRGLMVALCAGLVLLVFIGVYEIRKDKVIRTALLPIVAQDVRTGDNRSSETLFTVTPPEGGTAIIATQSAAILRDTGAMICAEELRSRDGQTRWEASPMNNCR